MNRRPLMIFLVVMSVLIGGVISYIQSPAFARLAKAFLANYIPKDLGIENDFSELKVMIFPPGVSVRNPVIRLKDRNVLDLPAGSTLKAERVDLTFRPVQMFSRNIRVHEISVVGGDINLALGDLQAASRRKKSKTGLRWDELYRIHADSVSFVDSRFHVEAIKPALNGDFTANRVRLAQWKGPGGLGYELEFDVGKIRGSFHHGYALTSEIERLNTFARLNNEALEVIRLEVTAAGLSAGASGKVEGDLLDSKSALNFSAETLFRGDIGKVLAAMAPAGKRPPVDAGGEIDFRGKLSGAVDRPLETLKVSGVVSGKDVRFEEWNADTLDAELAWFASPRGGELAVTKVDISARERAKVGGFQPGRGGRVEIGAFKLNLGALFSPEKSSSNAGIAPASVAIPIKLTRAHIHWLGAGVAKEIYALDLRVSGPVAATFRPAHGGKSWALDASVGLDIERFQLDNQKLYQSKPLFKILAVPKIRLDGDISIDRTAVHLTEVAVSSGPATAFSGGGKIDFKSGFDLSFVGSADLKDVGQIAENDIRGKGDIAVHVGGPLSSVMIDFEPEIEEVSYLRLHFGSLEGGKITWDDGTNRLLFSGIEAKRGNTSYAAEGVVDLGKGKDTIELGVRVPIGDVQDMMGVFDEMTQELWWYPRTLTGPLHGDARVTGGLSLDKLIVSARVNGSDWQQWGERFSAIQLQGGYDRGKFHLSEFNAVKRTGRVQGRISLDADRVLDWGVHTEGFAVADLDHFAKLDVPMRGRLSIESAGKGKEGVIQSSTIVRLEDFAVRGVPMPSSDLSVRTDNGRAELRGTALGGQGTLDASYDFKLGGKSSVHVRARSLDFSPALLMINPKLIQDREVRGEVSGSLDLTFQSGKIERGSGKVDFSQFQLSKTGARFELSHPISLPLTDGSFDIPDLSLKGPEGEATLALRSDQSNLEGSITGEVDVAAVGFLTSTVADSEGTAVLDFSLGGQVKAPTVFGKATFDGVMLKVAALESPFENCSGTFQLRQNVISIQDVEADLAGGRVSAEGTVEIFADRYPRIGIKGRLSGNKLQFFPFQFVKLRGGINVHGEELPYIVDGDLKVESALSTEKVMSQGKGETLKALQYTPPPSRIGAADYPKFKLNLLVAAESGVMIRNDLFDAEGRGKLRIVNTLEAPRLLGTAELIAGKLNFKDRSFQIQTATATFDNPAVINPSIVLSANTDVGGTKIQLYASGRLPDRWKIELSSNPVMPEPEIISLLATGMTSTDARKLSAADRSTIEQGEAASLLLNSLDFNRDLQAKTGFAVDINEANSAAQTGASAFDKPGAADGTAQPKLVIRRKIGSRFELSYGQTVGSSTVSNGRAVTGEYRFTSGFSALGVYDNYGTSDARQRQSFGADLKFQTRFK